MEEKEKKHIDNLFRDGLQAEKVEIPYQERNWKSLEDRLSGHRRRKRLLLWLRPLGGAAALLLLSFIFWLLWPGRAPLVSDQVSDKQETERKQDIQKGDSNRTEKQIFIVEEQEEKHPVEESAGLKESNPPIEQEKRFIAELEEDKSQTNRQVSLIAPGSTMESLVNLSPELPVLKINPVKELKQDVSNAENRNPTVLLKPKDEPKLKKMAFTVLAAPAYNGVDNLDNSKIGGDFGLMYSLALSKRWSISTGAIYALKWYEADGDSYSPGTDGAYGNNPTLINADCRVLDVPLNINYKLLALPKMSVSVGTGVSSYFMLSEKYSYQYAYGPEQKDAVSLKNNSIHWASVLNFQASIERQLSPHISVSLQPYLKMPFEGIGYGHVRLQSFGIALGTSFHF